jgi:hypothetical protein
MATSEFQEMILKVIKHAETAKLSEFQLIATWAEYRNYKGKRKAFKLLVDGLRKSSDRLFKKYCRGVTVGFSNFNTLLAYQRLVSTAEFYKKELAVIDDMLDEYETYLFSQGNLLWAHLGAYRSDADMRDYRKKD